jgi:hypothetical protein
MKRLQILLSSRWSIGLSYPIFSFKNDGILKTLLRLSIYLGYLAIFLGAILIGFLSSSGETPLFHGFIIFILVSLALLGINIVLSGWKILVDPANFLTVLTFSLLLTLCAVFSIEASRNNTFGSTSFRGLSGIFVISLIVLYYFINIYIRDIVSFRKLINTLIAGLLIFFVYCSLALIENSSIIGMNIYIIGILIALLTLIAVLGKRRNLLFTVILLIVGLITFSNIGNGAAYSTQILSLVWSFLITTLIVFIIYIVSKKDRKTAFAELRAEFKNRKINIIQLINKHPIIKIAGILIVLIGLTMFVTNKLDSGESFIVEKFRQISTAFMNLGDSEIVDLKFIQQILFGVGSKAITTTSSFIVNLINSLGLLGFAAYLFLILNIVYKATTFFNKNIRSPRNNLLSIITLFISIFVPIISLFVYPGLAFILIWWMFFSLISTSESKDFNEKDNVILMDSFEVKRYRIAISNISIKSPVVQTVLIIGIVAIVGYILTIVKTV